MLRIWDKNTGALTKTLTGHTLGVSSISLSADGSRLLSGSYDKTLRLWDAQTGRLLKTISGQSTRVLSVALSPDGHQLASTEWDNTFKLWDADTGTLLKTFTGYDGKVIAVAFTPDGKQLLSGSRDHTLRLWDAQTGNVITSVVSELPAKSWLFLDGGHQVLVITEANTLELREISTLNLVKEYENTGFFTDMTYQPPLTPDGRYEIYMYYRSAFLRKR
ncbi:hypothetical protein GCM10023187_52860 [Nibrella viscosa]|uniref:WD domain-containing protein, G-beta repeat-containing protein n=2 Tax=Nibrella viscosa TaxID=1084524 RepID=A0ABP8KYM7_9BACT